MKYKLVLRNSRDYIRGYYLDVIDRATAETVGTIEPRPQFTVHCDEIDSFIWGGDLDEDDLQEALIECSWNDVTRTVVTLLNAHNENEYPWKGHHKYAVYPSHVVDYARSFNDDMVITDEKMEAMKEWFLNESNKPLLVCTGSSFKLVLERQETWSEL